PAGILFLTIRQPVKRWLDENCEAFLIRRFLLVFVCEISLRVTAAQRLRPMRAIQALGARIARKYLVSVVPEPTSSANVMMRWLAVPGARRDRWRH
ncbi:MAG TPA: hypothetical protein VHM64_19185, partial [Candidatus Binatia bacterium]|nr:hypothetical protein [Candidatus Binatia bacterium]